eukprot:294269-Heterocapsa_arctica.AAC.1
MPDEKEEGLQQAITIHSGDSLANACGPRGPGGLKVKLPDGNLKVKAGSSPAMIKQALCDFAGYDLMPTTGGAPPHVL